MFGALDSYIVTVLRFDVPDGSLSIFPFFLFPPVSPTIIPSPSNDVHYVTMYP